MASSQSNEIEYMTSHAGAWVTDESHGRTGAHESDDVVLEPHPDAGGVYTQDSAAILAGQGVRSEDTTAGQSSK
ncbi:hypothetical protein HBH64_117170 [Parastagonospora nodorum]|nr:hypothetical protein HBH51_023280 [Parastagonospora nodorum]KAH4310716.1 hypothetical protein HBI02_098780 [Parastagonospora nodorum]KAH4496616.1 hypothetical protein HBH88_092120 [Parastagonospora nodorum]KAH4587298.1 hypothetical protein HBH83_136270 [Parastagonospora nodorum]KAH4677556.1 hypothetical protein HBH80_056240 [Parastagonospora nodorum]